MKLFAHAGETHTTDIEANLHQTTVNEAIFTPIVLIFTVLILYAIYKNTKNLNLTMIVGLATLFAYGVLLFSSMPILAAISLALGFAVALFFVIISLATSN